MGRWTWAAGHGSTDQISGNCSRGGGRAELCAVVAGTGAVLELGRTTAATTAAISKRSVSKQSVQGNVRCASARATTAPVDYSRAPGPAQKKPDATTSIVVMGDANADWLAYGLEDAFSDKPEIGIVRKHRTDSGLIRYEGRRDTEWSQVARDVVAAEKPKYIVMMIGNNDRQSIRERAPPVVRPGAPKAAASPAPASAPAAVAVTSDPEQQSSAEAVTPGVPPANLTPEQARQAAVGPWRVPHREVGDRLYPADQCRHRRPRRRRCSGECGRPAVAARPQGQCQFRLSQRDLPQPGGEGRHHLRRCLGWFRRQFRPVLAARP